METKERNLFDTEIFSADPSRQKLSGVKSNGQFLTFAGVSMTGSL